MEEEEESKAGGTSFSLYKQYKFIVEKFKATENKIRKNKTLPKYHHLEVVTINILVRNLPDFSICKYLSLFIKPIFIGHFLCARYFSSAKNKVVKKEKTDKNPCLYGVSISQ